MSFTTGTVYFSTWPEDLTIGSNTYLGLGGTLNIGAVKEVAGTALEEIQMSIPALPAIVALTLSSTEQYRGRPVTLSLLVIDRATWNPVGAPKVRFVGNMQPVKIERTPSTDGDSTGKITMGLTRSGLNRSRRKEGVKMTDALQRIKFPGDTGLRYLRSLINNPTAWLTKEFQKQ
jgi:hypothetical protein